MAKISATRIAKALGVEAKQVFQVLQNEGWISRDGDKWQLNEAGLAVGGEMLKSDKFGEYIAWPDTLSEHKAFKTMLPDWLTATKIAEQFAVAPKLVNLAFADAGLLQRDQRGWMMTPLAEKLGADQRNAKQGFYVAWPKSLLNHDPVVSLLEGLSGISKQQGLDGRNYDSLAHQRIGNWLYLHNIAFAYKKAVPGSDYSCGFYLPERAVFIEYWGLQSLSESLSDKMKKSDVMATSKYKYIELGDEELKDLDEALVKKLLQFGLQVY